MTEMGSVFLAKTSEGIRCFITDPQAFQLLTQSGCELRLDPNVDPKACAMDILNQGVEKGIVVPGSIYPVGLQQEQDFLNFCDKWCSTNELKIEEVVALLDSAYQVFQNMVNALANFRCSSDRNAFLWVDEDNPKGHPFTDVIDLWSARNSDQDFSYARFGADTEKAILETLQN